MKKNKIFIAAGTLALAIAGFLTTKANNKKYAIASSAYYFTAAGANIITAFAGVSGYNIWKLTTATSSGIFFKAQLPGGSQKVVFAVKNGTSLNTTLFQQLP